MKVSQIIEGREYVWQPASYARKRRVTVIETAVERTERRGYARSRVVRNGVRIKYVVSGQTESTETVVPGREIIQPWDEYEIVVRAAAERKALNKQLHLRRLREQLKTLSVVEARLEDRGVEAEWRRLGTYASADVDEIKNWFTVRIVPPDNEDGRLPGPEALTRIPDLGDVLYRDRIGLRVIDQILGIEHTDLNHG